MHIYHSQDFTAEITANLGVTEGEGKRVVSGAAYYILTSEITSLTEHTDIFVYTHGY